MEYLINSLKRRHAFHDWCGCNTLDEILFLWRYYSTGTEIPGWSSQSKAPVDLPHARRFNPSIWRPQHREGAEPLRVDAYECASREAAHEFLIESMTQLSAPGLQRRREDDLGDVSFGVNVDTAVLFARANLVVLVANGGPLQVPVLDIARGLDRSLVARPRMGPGGAEISPPGAVVMGESVAIGGEPVAIDFEDQPATAYLQPGGRPVSREVVTSRPLSYKIFSRGCEIFTRDTRVHLKPLASGTQRVELYAMDSKGGIGYNVLTLDVK